MTDIAARRPTTSPMTVEKPFRRLAKGTSSCAHKVQTPAQDKRGQRPDESLHGVPLYKTGLKFVKSYSLYNG